MDYGHRQYDTINALNNGNIVEIGGIKFRKIPGEIEIGDLYIAERNTGPKLLELLDWSKDKSYAIPKSNDYCFDKCECVRIEEVQ